MVIGAALTAAAAFFLMQYPFAMAMALTFIGALFAAAVPKTRKLA